MLLDIGKDDTSPSSKSLHFPKLHKFVEMFFANHRAQVGVVILVELFCSTKLVAKPAIYATGYLNRTNKHLHKLFFNTSSCKKAKTHWISAYFSSNSTGVVYHAPP